MKNLQIAPELALPLDAVTQTFGVLAVRGAGKSNAAAVMAEEMFAAGLPFVAVDPVGSWYGLRAPGSGPGLSIPIFGGHHGDVPLERGGAELVADTIVDERLSCVLDVSAFESESAKRQFLTAFAERLFRRKGQPGNEGPLHLFLEEADDYAPQRAMGPEMHRCLGAFQRIVKQGRARGLGATMITQRSAALNKDLLTQLETLIVLRTTSPQDRKAIAGWVEYHGQAKELLESLSGLQAGEAWVWSPHWLGIVERVHFRRRATFDSGATPKNVSGHRQAATLADVDLGALRTRMAATIERAKAEDPRELRKKVAELERQLAAASKGKPTPPPEIKTVEKPVLKDEQVRRLEAAAATLEKRADDLAREAREIKAALGAAAAATRAAGNLVQAASARRASEVVGEGRPVATSRPAPVVRPPRANANGNGGAELGNTGARRMLIALAQHHPNGLTFSKLSILTGITQGGGTWRTYMGNLRAQGWVEGNAASTRITPAGLAILGDYEPLPTGAALIHYWRSRLGDTGKRRIFDFLVDAYPHEVPQERVAQGCSIELGGGTWRTYVGELRSLELIVGRGELRASEALFT